MFTPIVFISIPALWVLQSYGSLFWFAGVVLLWSTRYTHQLGKRWGRAYYGLSMAVRPLGVLLIAFGWLVLYAPPSPEELWGPYERSGLVPLGNAAEVLCLVAILLFFGLGVWAVIKLGFRRSFLFRHVDDPLITGGPYALVRHPQFLSAIGIALFGVLLYGPNSWFYDNGFTALLMNWAMFALSLWLLAILEDRELTAHFGDEYREYAKRVPRMLPN